MDWIVERSTGSADAFHHRDLTKLSQPTVWIHQVEQPALVLGSSQREPIVDEIAAARAGVEVCRRRSGGGLVLVEPGVSCWIDVLVPPDSPLWDDDVNRAFLWVGDVWRRALEQCGIDRLEVHDGPMVRADAGRFLCFAGLGPGEVVRTMPAAVSKVVGLSQRRQRNIARFQGLFVASTDMDLTVRLVRPEAWPEGLDAARIPIGLDPGQTVDVDVVSAAFLDALPDA